MTIKVFKVGVGCAVYRRWRRLPIDRRLPLTMDPGLPEWREHRTIEKPPFRPYKDGDFSSTYWELHLFMTVK